MKMAGKVKWFGMGVLVSLLVLQLASPVFAALSGKTIEVFTGISIYVDDEKLNPVDANGNPVEVFAYNGTTYLPVRAVSDAVGKAVQWDGKTNSVYLGKHTGDKPAVWLTDLDYFTGWAISQSKYRDNLGKEHQQAVGRGINNTYVLNGQYSAISGTLFQKYENRSENRTNTLELYGDGVLLYSAEITKGAQPIDFYVDITGVLELKVVFYDTGYPIQDYVLNAAIADLGLWT